MVSLNGLIPADDLEHGSRPCGTAVDRGAFEYGASSTPSSGYLPTNDLWIRVVIDIVEKGPIEAIWQKGGEDTILKSTLIFLMTTFMIRREQRSWLTDIFVTNMGARIIRMASVKGDLIF